MTELPPSLVELAARYGVATHYEDWTGTQVAAPESTLIAVLAALGVAAADDEQRAAALAEHDRRYWQRSLPSTILARTGATSWFWVHVTHGDPVEVWIALEDAVPLEEGEIYLHQMMGLRVVTVDGEDLGSVTEIIETGANPVYVVRGSQGEILIPDTDQVIQSVDLTAGLVTVRLIEGLR